MLKTFFSNVILAVISLILRILVKTSKNKMWRSVALVFCSAFFVLSGCTKQPGTSILYYKQFPSSPWFGKNKFDCGPHEGLMANRQYYFSCDSTLLSSRYHSAAKAQAAYLKAHPDARLMLQGFSASGGSPNYSLVLGQNRADAVANFLRLQGVSATQLSTVSLGSETNPPYQGGDQSKNCRVDLVYLCKR